MKENKKKTIGIVISVIILIVIVLGAAYAYFVAQTGDGAKTNVRVTAETTDSLQFKTDGAISISATQENFAEGKGNRAESTIASAILTAGTGREANYNYYLYLNIDTNDFEYTTEEKMPELILRVIGPDNEEIKEIPGLTYSETSGGFDITTTTGLITIANNYNIKTTTTKTDNWNIEIELVNLNSNQNANSGKTLTADLKIQQEKERTFADYIIATAETDDTLYYHDEYLDYSARDASYRYSGSSDLVNNYICFGSDATPCPDYYLYRIIGVFDDDQDGNYQVKLIESIPEKTSIAFAQLNASILDEGFWNYIGEKTQLERWQSMVATTNWKNKGVDYEIFQSFSTPDWYDEEIRFAETDEYNRKVRLMYVSDYGYAASPTYWNDCLMDYSYDIVKENNWMHSGRTELTFTTDTSKKYNVVSISYDGSINSVPKNDQHEFRPVFYLESSVRYLEGNGTIESPYRVTM